MVGSKSTVFAVCFPQRIHVTVKCNVLWSSSEKFTKRNADTLQETLCFNACISAFVTDLTMMPLLTWSLFRVASFYTLNINKWLSKKEDVMCPLAIWIHIHNLYHTFPFQLNLGPDSSVGIVTRYGLDGPGTESQWGGEIFRTCPDRTWIPPNLVYNGYRFFPGGREAEAWR